MEAGEDGFASPVLKLDSAVLRNCAWHTPARYLCGVRAGKFNLSVIHI